MADIRIGTRSSALAMWQAKWVKSRLEQKHEGIVVEIVGIKTKGDKILDVPLAKVGGKGLFVKEIENAITDGRVDMAVHSMKDVPTELPGGLDIAVISEREDPRDAFIAREVKSFGELPRGAVVGTSSLRRQTQVLNRRPDLRVVTLRGNVNTRIRKLHDERMDGIILAASGIRRMEMEDVVTEYLSVEDSLPAVGQGALGIEAKTDDVKTRSLIEFLDHPETRAAVEAERAFLARLEGGCQVPIAAHAVIKGEKVTLEGLVGAIDGSVIYRDSMSSHVCEREALGTRLAEELLGRGARAVLEEAYGEID
ncbi:MAG: hydroxymethylbilane synthase [Candidatus Nitrospinota bacterium M3_3B_026]